MTYSYVSWSYQDEVTSAKLKQMSDNVRDHDHRSDGSQGAALVSEWQTATGVSAAGGWSLSGLSRYRLLLGGRLVSYDFTVTRTGPDIEGTSDTSPNPGNFPDVLVLSGIPVAGRMTAVQNFVGVALNHLIYDARSDGTIYLLAGPAGGGIKTGQVSVLRPLLWRN